MAEIITRDRIEELREIAKQIDRKKRLAPLVVLWLLLRRKVVWDAEPTTLHGVTCVRGRLADPYNEVWGTPDEPLPGGMYEHTMRTWYRLFGKWVCSWIWLWRNKAHGFARRWQVDMEEDEYFGPQEGLQTRPNGLWQERKLLLWGRFERLTGYRSYIDTTRPPLPGKKIRLVAVPVYARIKRA